MLTAIGLGIWVTGVWFTYLAFSDMGVSSPFITALLTQTVMTVAESTITNDRYRTLPETQKKIVLFFCLVFMSADIYFNFRGIVPHMGNVAVVLPEDLRGDVNATNTVIAVFLSSAIALLPEMFIQTHRIERRGMH
jgi:hypothetical protein